MLEFRRHAQRHLQAVRRGERLVLTYRGRPVARLEPIRTRGGKSDAEADALLRLDEYAVDGPGDALTNEEMDRMVYGG